MFGLSVHNNFLESLILHYLTYLLTNKILIFLTDINCVYCFHFLKFAFILYLFYILILYLFYVYFIFIFFRYLIHSMEFRSMILETLSDKIENEYLASHPNPADRKDGYGVLLKICCIRYRMFFFLNNLFFLF